MAIAIRACAFFGMGVALGIGGAACSSSPGASSGPLDAGTSSPDAAGSGGGGSALDATGATDAIEPGEAAAIEAGGAADAQEDAGPSPSPEASSPMPEAGPDTSVETIEVSATGSTSFKTSLTAGAAYLLKAVGSIDIGGQTIDAEYAAGAGGAAAMDMVGTTDVGIDVGLLQPNAMNHTTIVPPGPGRIKWYGAFRSDRTYYMWVTGAGSALSLKLVAPSTATGSGSIAVSLFALGPPPPAMYTPMDGPMPPAPAAPSIGRDALETIQVPVMKTVVMGKVTTDTNAIYLLQASGAGIVSKGTLTAASPHLGDAEYMDWPLSGAKFNDGECGAEFGIGVDELQGPAPCMGGIVYTHRKNWWGPYRNDHIYYMLYAGTGMPISFLYYDSGYGDNSPTDTLTVRIFPVP